MVAPLRDGRAKSQRILRQHYWSETRAKATLANLPRRLSGRTEYCNMNGALNCPNTPATWFVCPVRNADVRAYRKQNLIERYGADMRLPDLRQEIAQGRRHGQMHDACMVRYVDLSPGRFSTKSREPSKNQVSNRRKPRQPRRVPQLAALLFVITVTGFSAARFFPHSMNLCL